MKEQKDDRAKNEALAQIESIVELVSALDTEDDEARADTEQTINEDPLDVSVRGGWHSPGQATDNEEFLILLCTGGPAVRIVGKLGRYNEPERVRVQYQDWFTSWKNYPMNRDQEADVLVYAQQFYYGE